MVGLGGEAGADEKRTGVPQARGNLGVAHGFVSNVCGAAAAQNSAEVGETMAAAPFTYTRT